MFNVVVGEVIIGLVFNFFICWFIVVVVVLGGDFYVYLICRYKEGEVDIELLL